MLDEVKTINQIYRDPLFVRTLEEVRSQGGYGAVAAAKADEFLAVVLSGRGDGGRERFRFTRKGEYRIRNCRKVDLGCGYRIVCIQKDQRIVLLYIGTHDDCFRWIERHRTAEYDLDDVLEDAWVTVPAGRPAGPQPQGPKGSEEHIADEYEEALMSRIDDSVLRRVFAGIIEARR
jgi:hypothetical protein